MVAINLKKMFNQLISQKISLTGPGLQDNDLKKVH